MYNSYSPSPNTIGIVEFVDDKGQVHCQWETGGPLALVIGTDKFEIINS